MNEDIKKLKYFIIVIGKGKKDCNADIYFFKNIDGNFELVEKSPCFVGKNGWGKRSDEIGKDLTNLKEYKKEGDRKTPQGLFMLGRMFSHDIDKKTIDEKEPGNNPNLYCYEDLNEVYECCVPDSPVANRRNEPERMNNPLYKRAIFINYNYPVKNPRAGSCIFLHTGEKPTLGCVAMNLQMLDKIFQSISPNTTPILMVSNKEEFKNFPEADFLTRVI